MGDTLAPEVAVDNGPATTRALATESPAWRAARAELP
jgi:hypothetical protein